MLLGILLGREALHVQVQRVRFQMRTEQRHHLLAVLSAAKQNQSTIAACSQPPKQNSTPEAKTPQKDWLNESVAAHVNTPYP